MRKLYMLILTIMCLFTSTANADARIDIKRVEQIVGRDGITYIINENSNTIFDGQTEYKFSVSGNGESIEITYPDGSTYWEDGKDGSYSSGWSNDYIAFYSDNEKNYTPGDILCEVYRSDNPIREQKNFWLCIICFILGVFSLLLPEAAWYLQYGWRFKNAEPSDAAIIAERVIGGVILLLLCLYIIV